jgi:Ser/Thr protein kinase RdoA (MazF antagonist)
MASVRPPIHELGRHLAALEAALERHAGHPAYPRVAPLAEDILAAARRLDPLPLTPPRVVHGDPKINNILFHPDRDEALCLVDLDTVGRMALPLELGDALRSWCNPGGEDTADGRFSAPLFEAAVRGYGAATRGWITPGEVRALVPATATIQVELAARFCADSLNESYFGWDPARFPTRGEHNRVRAAGQLAVHRSLLLQKRALEAAVSAAFPGA